MRRAADTSADVGETDPLEELFVADSNDSRDLHPEYDLENAEENSNCSADPTQAGNEEHLDEEYLLDSFEENAGAIGGLQNDRGTSQENQSFKVEELNESLKETTLDSVDSVSSDVAFVAEYFVEYEE